MIKDATPIFLGVAALAVALHFFNQNHDLEKRIQDCQLKHEGFKEGVLYGK